MENMNNYHNETPEISSTSETLEWLQSEVNIASHLKDLSKTQETINKLNETYGTQIDIVAPGIIRISGKTTEDNTFLENSNGKWTLKWYEKTFASLEVALKTGTFISRISEVTWNDAQNIYLDDNGFLYIDKKWALDPNVSNKIVSDKIPIDPYNLEEIQDILAATRMQEEYINFDAISTNIKRLTNEIKINDKLKQEILLAIPVIESRTKSPLKKAQILQNMYQIAEWLKATTTKIEGIEIRIPAAHHDEIHEIISNTSNSEVLYKIQDIFGIQEDLLCILSLGLWERELHSQENFINDLLRDIHAESKKFTEYYNILKEEYHIQIVKRLPKKDTNISVSPHINTNGLPSVWAKTQHKTTTYVRVEISLPNGTKETKDIEVDTKTTSTGISFGGNTVIPTLKDAGQIKKFLDKPVGYTILKEKWQEKPQTWINLKNTLIAETP